MYPNHSLSKSVGERHMVQAKQLYNHSGTINFISENIIHKSLVYISIKVVH